MNKLTLPLFADAPPTATWEGLAVLGSLDAPEPTVPAIDRTFSLLVTGIGGNGVVTVGAILGMAAHLEDKPCTVLDM